MAVCKDGIQRHAVLASQALPEVYICLGTGHCVLAHDDLLNSRTWRNFFSVRFLVWVGLYRFYDLRQSSGVALRQWRGASSVTWRRISGEDIHITARVFRNMQQAQIYN